MGVHSSTTPGAGTWTCPTGVFLARIQLWPGGGGGEYNFSNGGAGGGGGEYAEEPSFVTVPGTIYTYVVGTGGLGAVGGGAGANGTDTTFNVVSVTAHGGLGGGSVTLGVGGAGGSSSPNTIHYNGGAGANSGGSNPHGGAGGGSSAGDSTVGNSGTGPTGNTGGPGGSAPSGGGAGGAGGNAQLTGVNGTQPGGGGGGGGSYNGTGVGNGGNGASGQIIITWTDPVVDNPPPHQASQRWDALPVFDSWWEQFRHAPVPLTSLPPLFPRQRSQIIVTLFDYWQEWEAYHVQPIPVPYIPTAPLSHQTSQGWNALSVVDSWWEQFRSWPVPVQFIPTPPPTRQLSQRWDEELKFDALWWEQYTLPSRTLIPPSTFFVSQEGVYGVYNLFVGIGQAGTYRVQNNIERYNVYVGTDALPDLTQTPTAFAQTLPITVAVTPPVSGTRTFYVLCTKQDTYGLQSQNQFYETFTIDQFGNIVMGPIPVPQNLKLTQLQADKVLVLAVYPTLTTDRYPADIWKLWAGATPPNPSIDTPVFSGPVSKILNTQIGPYSPGLLYVTVGLYRSADNTTSPTLQGSITLSTTPAEVTAVFSGFDVEP